MTANASTSTRTCASSPGTTLRSETAAGRYGAWRVVAGCVLALATSSGAVVAFTLSLFIGPLGEAFHWSRTTISLGFSMMTLCLALSAPWAGRVFDRFGVRRTLLVVVPLFAIGLASFSLLNGSVPAYLALFGLVGVLGAFHSSIPYVKVVSEWFDERRGLALGITMTGVALGGVLMTQAARWAMARQDWRAGFLAVAAVILVLGFSAVLLLVRERPAQPAGDGQAGAVLMEYPGATVREALHDGRFWTILLFVFFMSMTVNGMAASGAAILVWKGVSASEAARMLSFLAMSSLLGRLITGVLLDRLFAPYVASLVCVITLAGMGLLALGTGTPMVLTGLVAVGFALGAETDIIGYMISRYCGLRSFGALFGLTVGVFALAPAVGLPLLGVSFDRHQSYGPALAGFAAAVGVAGLIVLWLGPYRHRPGAA